MQTQRLNITLPNELARELRRSIPLRSRSKFIAEAVGERLKHKRNLKRELVKSLKANYEFYKKIGREIEEDFRYADAEVLKRLP
ncbi:MAG: hypothetical protein Q7S60_03360 [bacterium]|nr:hypothetical protein [bacterium]